MPQQPDPTGAFRFRYTLRANGKLVVWYRAHDDAPEAGPIELDQQNANRLGDILEQAVQLLKTASRSRHPSEPELEFPSPLQTDPFALKDHRRSP